MKKMEGLNWIGISHGTNKNNNNEQKVDGKKINDKITLAQALSDGIIDDTEADKLKDYYSQEDLRSFYSGNFSERVKMELQEAGYSEDFIRNLQDEYKAHRAVEECPIEDVKMTFEEIMTSANDKQVHIMLDVMSFGGYIGFVQQCLPEAVEKHGFMTVVKELKKSLNIDKNSYQTSFKIPVNFSLETEGEKYQIKHPKIIL